jgi:2-C-methyl-D-erythritol 4-phosphate cytidylyltransferase / 2-C-methyl-D-erythritol 2,4-cyclodiphosphate synthase
MGGCYAILVAAGRGRRVGGEIPKQYRRLGHETVLAHAVRHFCDHPAIQGIRVVIHPDDRGLYDEATQGLQLMDPVVGGQTRQESAFNGIESLAASQPDYVMIHDAARPFVTAECISAAHAALAESTGVLAAVPVVDTLKRAVAGVVGGTVERNDAASVPIQGNSRGPSARRGNGIDR